MLDVTLFSAINAQVGDLVVVPNVWFDNTGPISIEDADVVLIVGRSEHGLLCLRNGEIMFEPMFATRIVRCFSMCED